MKNQIFKRIFSSIILLSLLIFFIFKIPSFLNFLIPIVFIFVAYEWHMMSKEKIFYLYGYVFIFVSLFSVYKIVNLDDNYLFFTFVVAICVSTDIGGYTIGKIFKGPKLTKISPKKTYSGMFGGYLFSIIGVMVIFHITENSIGNKFNINHLLIILISSVSQMGDLCISYFKRLSGIKDTGNIIPGHGGVLDRVDGMIFAFPFAYAIYIIFNFKIV